MSALNPEKALIFRITHIANVPWLLNHGLHCRNSAEFDPDFRNIGNPDLIVRRHLRHVPVPPGGTLSDYVPFYFTPFSIMLFNIKTGYGGVPKQPNDRIVILVSSLRKVAELGIQFVFTNQHAYPVTAEYFNTLDDLGRVDWPLLQARDFRHDPEDPGKKELTRQRRWSITTCRWPGCSASAATVLGHINSCKPRSKGAIYPCKLWFDPAGISEYDQFPAR